MENLGIRGPQVHSLLDDAEYSTKTVHVIEQPYMEDLLTTSYSTALIFNLKVHTRNQKRENQIQKSWWHIPNRWHLSTHEPRLAPQYLNSRTRNRREVTNKNISASNYDSICNNSCFSFKLHYLQICSHFFWIFQKCYFLSVYQFWTEGSWLHSGTSRTRIGIVKKVNEKPVSWFYFVHDTNLGIGTNGRQIYKYVYSRRV